MRFIYLDYAASTPIAASVQDAMSAFYNDHVAHPNSQHWAGRAVQEAIEDARSHVATLLKCHPTEILFTSGGTESNNLALLGLARSLHPDTSTLTQPPEILVSPLEHACVLECCRFLSTQGWKVKTVGCDKSGVIDLDQLNDAISETTRIVSVMHASHRIGTLQPIPAIAEICHSRDIFLHTDACQSVGKTPISMDELGADLLSLSGHKMYAPKGIGALYIKSGTPVAPMLFGETAESGLRPGTANVAHIVALGQSCKLAHSGVEQSAIQLATVRNRFLELLQKALGREIQVHGAAAERVTSILSICLPGINANNLRRALPEICFSIEQDNQCTSNQDSLSEIGLTQEESQSTLRFSFGWNTSEEELQQATQMLATACDNA